MNIRLEELNRHSYPTTPEIDANLNTLLLRLNAVRDKYGQPMVITSGLRSSAQQEALIAAGKSTAHASMHLRGAAADVFDQDGSLKKWIMNNLAFVEEVGFWMEDFGATPNWVHFQQLPPYSGKRFFLP